MHAGTLNEPTMYFIGVTTARSAIMRIFPHWARHLGLGECRLTGIDFAQHDRPEAYRRAVAFIKGDPLALGAVVTTHKIDLLRACRDLFDRLGPHAELMGEVSAISKHEGHLVGTAKDTLTSGLALEAFLTGDHWTETEAEVFIMGAGGSAVAVSAYLLKPEHGKNRPRRVTVSNRSLPRLKAIEAIHDKLAPGVPREYHHTPNRGDNDAALGRLPPHSLVINATGLGKDAPGSPLTDSARFPERGLAWDFNYRGDLLFLAQARAQERERHLLVEDGWRYFIYGWTQIIAEVFHIAIPTEGSEFDALSRIAELNR